MACQRRVYACRVSFLNCNQIHPSLPQSLRPSPVSRCSAEAALSTKPVAADSAKDTDEEDTGFDVLDLWRPLFPAPPQAAAATSRPARPRDDGSNGDDSDMLNVWLCPEIDSRQRNERMRRQKAEQLAERMTALVHASNINKDSQEERRRGMKRKTSDVPAESSQVESAVPLPVPLLPSSPDLAKPQSLLIPSLLPKGMLRTHLDSTAAPDSATKAQQQEEASRPPALDFGNVDELTGAMPLSLGLDLGFDIAQSALPQNPLSGMRSSIMEIADFLERDIDVFTPLSAAWTPRLTTTPSTSPGFPPNPKSPVTKQRELIEDIVKLSF